LRFRFVEWWFFPKADLGLKGKVLSKCRFDRFFQRQSFIAQLGIRYFFPSGCPAELFSVFQVRFLPVFKVPTISFVFRLNRMVIIRTHAGLFNTR